MYYYKYQNRLQKLLVSQELASFIVLSSFKRTVDYGRLFSKVLSIFDLEPRGLVEVFRNLVDRVDKECVFPLLKQTSSFKKKKLRPEDWLTPKQMKVKIMDRIIGECLDKAYVMASAYLECLELLGAPNSNYTEYLHTVGFYFILAIEGQFEKFLKYQTASLVALSLSNECDEKPGVVSRGKWSKGDFSPYLRKVTKWIRKMCIQRRHSFGVQLAYSLYNVKRISPPADERFVRESLNKNEEALTTERPLPDVIRLKEACLRTVRELFQLSKGGRIDFNTATSAAHQRNKEIKFKGVKLSHSLTIPSISACYENSRKNGGALDYLLRRQGLHIDTRYGEPILLGFVSRVDKFSQPVEVYGLLDEEELVSLMRPDLSGMGGRVLVRREAILEPFKVRIISKGEAEPYQVCKNYQPFLWSILQLAECFELTGRPVECLDIENMLHFGKDTWQHCLITSGDYSQATDNLHPFLCDATLSEICRLWKIPFEDGLVLWRCLLGHRIDLSSQNIYAAHKDGGPGGEFQLPGFLLGQDVEVFQRLKNVGIHNTSDYMELRRLIGTNYSNRLESDDTMLGRCEILNQEWGQLMGSFVSFPILCIINAAVTRESLEKAFDLRINLTDHAFKVNGDDDLFVIPPSGYQTWVRNVTSAGLSPSIGKNFISRRYAVINSQMFDCGLDWDWRENSTISVKKVPIIYMNLLRSDTPGERGNGLGRVVKDDLKRGGDLSSRLRELIDGFPVEMRDKLLKRSLYYNCDLLKRLPPVSWYLPKCLGGLELPKPSDAKVSTLHLKIASMILCLDEKVRRDIVKLQWMKSPGNAFCELTNSQINQIQDRLKNPLVLRTSKTEDRIFGPLIKSNLGFGLDEGLNEPEEILKSWKKMYQKWVRKVENIRWTDSKDHNVRGLHSMNEEKALNFKGLFWTRESLVSWN
jgi:hypothetical protein